MILRRIGVWSAAKLNGVLYALVGLLIGIVVSLLSVLGALATSEMSSETGFGAFPAMFIGVGAIVALPILYGLFGLIGGAIGAAIYNIVAGMMGGLELELTAKPGPMTPTMTPR
jgi:hypothetical protein